MRFERNDEDDSGFRPGNEVTLEWRVGKHLGTFQAGGYSQRQSLDDKGYGASNDRSSRHAIGLELDYLAPGTGVLLKGAAYQAVSVTAGSVAAAKSSVLRVTLVKTF
jgi:hypothetical protein